MNPELPPDDTTGTGTEPGTRSMRDAARELDEAGMCVLPAKEDGSKMPDLRHWKQYQKQRSTPKEHDKWFDPDRYEGARTGICVVYGAVSGNAEMLELEHRAIAEGLLEEAAELMEAHGFEELWERITTGYARRSAGGGMHFDYRVDGCPVKKGVKIAQRPAREDECTDSDRARLAKNPQTAIPRCLVETRGEGNIAVVDPSHGTVHASGRPYERLTGSPASIPVITAEEYEAVHAILGLLDQMPRREYTPPGRKPAPRPDGRKRPGDDFNDRADWQDILKGIFRPIISRGSTTYWGWADGAGGVKATTGRDPEKDRLWVFTTSSEFDTRKAYDKFGAYTLLNHNGDWKAAAQDLKRQHYGDPLPHQPLASVTPLRPRSTAPQTDGSNALHQDPSSGPEAEYLEAGDSRPKVDIGVEAEAIESVLGLMARRQLPELYTRAEGPVWITQDNQAYPVMHHLGADNLRAYMAEHVLTYTVVKNEETGGTKEVRTLLHPRTCSTILGRKHWPLPKLTGMVTSPVVRPDGSLILEPGYDDLTGLYLHPRVPLRRLQPEITDASIQKAMEIILGQMLKDFPWVDESDKAHFLGALLTPVLRPYFHGPTPMFIITATAAASGKSLLKDILDYCYGISSTPWPENEAELRKSITTQLYTAGQPAIVLDNLPNGFVIKSPTLSNLLTSVHWSDRVLGSNSKVTMPNDRVWILTGNKLTTGGDNARRAIWVRLDPQCPNPDQRDGFTVGDLRAWLRSNTSTVVAALVTMVRSWLAAGAQTVNTRMGDYSEWASTMAGLLHHLGIPGWMADRSVSTDMDTEVQEWTLLLSAWREKFQGQGITAGEAVAAFPDLLPDIKGQPPSPKQFGHWLKARAGRFYGNFKLVSTPDAHRKQNVWRVDVYDAGAHRRSA